jgi:hypothetical protein
MQEERAQRLTPPGELRPAQLGIVLLGRVILRHISATLADLAQRGFLGIDEVPGDGEPDWLLTDLRDPGAGRSALLRYEATLLDGLFARQGVVRLSEIGRALIPALSRVRAQLRRDAVRQGRLRRWHRDQRTPGGEQLLRQIHVFRRDLRGLAASGNPGALAGLAPYAMVFGLKVPSAISFGADGTPTAQHRETEAQWSHSDRFATSWLAACAGFSHSPGHGHRSAPSDDFAHQWSAPRDHGHGSHGHGSGHGGYGGSHGDFGGGHGGGAGHGGQ